MEGNNEGRGVIVDGREGEKEGCMEGNNEGRGDEWSKYIPFITVFNYVTLQKIYNIIIISSKLDIIPTINKILYFLIFIISSVNHCFSC